MVWWYLRLSVLLGVCCAPGRCYPCVQLVRVSCTCGKTELSVACGRERSVKLPRCRQPCLVPALCGHSNAHHCHEGDCPPCRERCGQPLACGHQCEAKCHATPYLIHKVNGIGRLSHCPSTNKNCTFRQLQITCSVLILVRRLKSLKKIEPHFPPFSCSSSG